MLYVGPEAGPQRVGPGRREPGHGHRVDAAVPQHDGVALDVDAAPSGPPGQLGVLRRRDVGVRLTVELHQLFEHDRARRHVDAERQGLGREDGLDRPCGEQLLDDLRKVGSIPAWCAAKPRVEPVDKSQ